MTLVICEQSSSGHRLDYVSYLIDRALDAGSRVELMTSDAATTTPEFARFVDRFESSAFSLKTTLLLRGGVKNQFVNTWRVLRRARALGAQVIIPNVDEKLVALALLRPVFPSARLRGLIMRPASGDARRRDRIKSFLQSHLTRTGWVMRELTSPFVDDHPASAVLDPSGILHLPVGRGSLESRHAGLDEWKALNNRPVLAVLGALNDRKSVVELMRSLGHSSRYRLLVAGAPTNKEYEDQILREAKNLPVSDIYLMLRSLSDAELDQALEIADGMALLYSNTNGSSGLLAHALSRNLPCVGLSNQTVNRAICRHHAGTVAKSKAPEDIAHAAEEALATQASGLAQFGKLRERCESDWSMLASTSSETESLD